MPVCHTKPWFVFIYLFRVCSVLPGSENWSRLHYQHQGVFKRMLVPKSGGKLPGFIDKSNTMFWTSLFHDLSLLSPLQFTEWLKHCCVLVLWSAYPAGICFPLTSMLSVTLTLIRQDRELLWLVVFNSVYFLLISLSLFYCSDVDICLLPQVKTIPKATQGIHYSAGLLKRCPNIGKSFTDVGSFLCLRTSLFVTATLDSNFSSSFINNPFWSWVTSLGFL